MISPSTLNTSPLYCRELLWVHHSGLQVKSQAQSFYIHALIFSNFIKYITFTPNSFLHILINGMAPKHHTYMKPHKKSLFSASEKRTYLRMKNVVTFHLLYVQKKIRFTFRYSYQNKVWWYKMFHILRRVGRAAPTNQLEPWGI